VRAKSGEVGQGDILRDDADTRGWNGAALTAFGEMAVDFFGAEVPFPDKRDGVKLGESTLKRFLLFSMMSDEILVADAKAEEIEEL
jgi:hypothetical protein